MGKTLNKRNKCSTCGCWASC